jgi:hypothetical protein
MSDEVKKWACVKTGKVELVIIWDGIEQWSPAADYEMVELSEESFAGIGFDYDGKNFIDNRPQEPIES